MAGRFPHPKLRNENISIQKQETKEFAGAVLLISLFVVHDVIEAGQTRILHHQRRPAIRKRLVGSSASKNRCCQFADVDALSRPLSVVYSWQLRVRPPPSSNYR